MKTKLLALIRRIGHRGAFLLFLALLDFLYGFSIWATPPVQQSINLTFSWAIWGAIWAAVGTVLLVGAFLKDDRIPFALAATLKGAWAAVWAKLWLTSPHSIPRAWVSVVIWLAFAAIVVIVSTWPENHRHKRVTTTQNCIEVPVIESEVPDEDDSV